MPPNPSTPPGVSLVLGVLASSALAPAAGYSIAYYDCHDIKNLLTFKITPATCGHPNMDNEKDTTTTTLTLLQRKSIMKMSGNSCNIKVSRFVDYCGAYSHSKIIETPSIELSYVLAPLDCLDLIVTKVFTTPDGIKRPVTPEAENVFSIEELGSINIGEDTISCQGQPKRVGGHVVNDVLQIAQWKVTIKKENFRVKDGEVEATSAHLRLPRQACSVGTLGCRLHDITYVWHPPRDQCPMELVRDVAMTEENGFLRNSDLNILLKKGEKVPSPSGCPSVNLWKTEYDNLFLSTPGEGWPDMTDDLDLTDYIKARDDYIMYETEQKFQELDQNAKGAVCRDGLNLPGHIIKLDQEGVFYRRNGDTVERFECPKKIGALPPNLDTCYQDIPLANKAGFVKPHTRILTTFSAAIPCNAHHGLKVITEEGVWIEFNPSIHKITNPLDLPVHSRAFQHEDLSQGGLFTDTELEAWRKHLELGDIHDAVTKSLSYGVCAEAGTCGDSPGVPRNNIEYLAPDARVFLNTLDLASKLHKFIEVSSGYIGLIVLILESIKFLNFAAALSITIMRGGVQEVKALLWMMCCHPHQTANRIARRHRRLDLKRKRSESDDGGNKMELARLPTESSQEPDL